MTARPSRSCQHNATAAEAEAAEPLEEPESTVPLDVSEPYPYP